MPASGMEHGRRWLLALALALALGSSPAEAQQAGAFGAVVRIELDAFGSDAGTITFSELPVDTRNPVFYPASYGGPEDGPMVGFGGIFEGQRLGTRAECPPGARLSGCVTGQPEAPLRLATSGPHTQIATDNANPDSPSLSGMPLFNGPVTIVFDKDVAGVGLAGGYFNDTNSTAIQAFDRNGQLIGGVRNIKIGMEYMALVTADGSNRIAGLQFSLVGAEQAGFGIDNVSFALSSQLRRENIEGLQGEPELADSLPAMHLMYRKDPAPAP